MANEIVRERGERDCVTCGKPHDLRPVESNPKRWGTWADPDDGHPYRPESWETIARRLMAREKAAEGGRLAVDEHADALRKLAAS